MTTLTPPTLPAAPTGTARLTAATAADLGEHLHRLGALPRPGLDPLVRLAEDAGLTGRGGAGFPTGRKLAAVAGAGRRPVVVANAMEGEPASHKDRFLLTHAPHLVLDGLEVVATALGARRRVLAVGERTDHALAAAAVAQRGDATEVRRLGGGFVGGQESALVNQLAGRPAVPSDPHRPVWAAGLDGRPTLVANAETLAHLALAVRWGAAWFRSVGTAADPGTFLASVSGTRGGVVARPGVLEVARGTPLRSVLEASGTDLARVRGVLVGGYHGAWVGRDAVDVPLARESLAAYDAGVGAGVLVVLDDATCPLAMTAEVATYLAGQVAGQCGPCVNGLPRMADTLRRLARPGADPRLVAEVDRLRGLVVGRGACAHPDGTARLVASTMRVFDGHVRDHLAGVCR